MDKWSILSVLAGGAITWLVSWWYYKRAGDALKCASSELIQKSDGLTEKTDLVMKKTVQLQGLVNVLARYLRDAGVIDAKFDKEGNVAYFVNLEGHLTGTGTLKATLSLVNPPPGSTPATDPEKG